MFSSNQRFSTFFLEADAAPEPPRGQEELGPCLGDTDPPTHTFPTTPQQAPARTVSRTMRAVLVQGIPEQRTGLLP